MGMIDPEQLKVGDIFYECDYGFNGKFEVITKPEYTEVMIFDKTHTQLTWQAKNVINGDIVDYCVTLGMSGYIKLYNAPQYVSNVGDKFVFKLVGGGVEEGW